MYAHERSLVNRMKDRPFALIGVNSDPDRDLLMARIQDEKISWRSFWCGPGGGWGRIPSQWGIRGWPKIYVLDQAGVLRFENLNGDRRDAAVERLVAAAAAQRDPDRRQAP